MKTRMYLSSGFKALHIYLMLASSIIYNSVFTNATEGFVILNGKYVWPPMTRKDPVSLDECKKTKYPNYITCFLAYSPRTRFCGFSVDFQCKPLEVKSSSRGDTTIYMRTVYTSSSSTVSSSSTSSLVAPTLTSKPYSSAATISASTSTTFLPQSTLTQILPSDVASTLKYILSSDLAPASSDIVESVPFSSDIAPTSTIMASNLIFTSALVTSYQEIITTSIEMSASSDLIMTKLSSDLLEVTPSLQTSILLTPPFESTPVSDSLSSLFDTASVKVSREITVGPSCTNKIPMSSDYQCQYKCYQEPTEKELEKSIASIKKELTVNKSTLSKTIRSKTSAPDDRPSSTYIGMVGIVVMGGIFALLVISDIPQLYQHAKILKRNLLP